MNTFFIPIPANKRGHFSSSIQTTLRRAIILTVCIRPAEHYDSIVSNLAYAWFVLSEHTDVAADCDRFKSIPLSTCRKLTTTRPLLNLSLHRYPPPLPGI